MTTKSKFFRVATEGAMNFIGEQRGNAHCAVTDILQRHHLTVELI